ncbi:MAG: SDR family NAD(P)-dependent oxidoreductase, partial [Pirellulaceae bacterium]|nr:SDR family NAD(P)-dependent oxidoreductase [Pirellulaceae bacterium]
MGSASCWSVRRVWFTGASGGIGRAIAERLDPLGARLALTARREASLRQLAESLSGEAVVAAADVSDLGQMQSAGARVAAELGDVDVLIACAGVYRLTDGRQWDAATVNEVLRINVEGVSNAIAVVAPSMVQRGAGHIAAVSSLAGLAPMPGGAAYCASKAALIALLDSLRLDLRQAGVKVTTIAPGYVDTPMITDEERQTLHDLV